MYPIDFLLLIQRYKYFASFGMVSSVGYDCVTLVSADNNTLSPFLGIEYSGV